MAAVFAAVTLPTAAYAAVDYVCHPDPPGTRTLTLPVRPTSYAMAAGTVEVVYARGGSCHRVRWNLAGGARRTTAAPLQDCERSPAASVVRRGHRSISLRAGSADRPDRIDVRAGDRLVRSWPLPVRVRTLDVHDGTAVVASDGAREAHVVRLADGRVSLLAPIRRLDTPQIESPGVTFQDNLSKRDEAQARTVLKFFPASAVRRSLDDVGRPVRVPDRVVDFAMDGPRVAMAIRGREGRCDRVDYWNILWRYTAQITEDEERTCRLMQRGSRITAVSLAGLRAAWTMASPDADRIVAASSVDCYERLVATADRRAGARVHALAGDGEVLGYAIGSRGSATLGALGRRMRGDALADGLPAPRAVVADGGRLALLRTDGTIELRNRHGRLLHELEAPAARAIALRADRLVVLTRSGHLAVIDTESGSEVDRWTAPAGAASRLDVHFGVAVVSAGRTVVAVSLATGRRAVVARAPAHVTAEIEAPGVAYGYDAGTGSVLRFVPFAHIEQALRR